MEDVMKYYIIIALLLISGVAFALDLEQCTTQDNLVSVRISNTKNVPDLTKPDPNQLVLSRTYALPYKQAALTVNQITWSVFDKSGNFLTKSNTHDENSVYIARSFIFREMYGVTVNMHKQVEDEHTIKILDEIDFSITGTVPAQLPQAVSPSFEKAYKKLAANYDTSYLRNLPLSRPKLLILSHSTLTNYLANFVSWKKSKGYEVYIVNVQDVGNTPVVIRDYLLTHYLQYQCDHLLILGDVTGSFAIPTNIYNSPDGIEQDADDNYYTMLLGDDYFPEMLPGRFSFGDISELLVMMNKTISYERAPFMTNTNWMNRSLVVAGNYAEGGLRPVTPIWMSRWLREKMLSKGFAQVDTVFYPPTLTGASAITASINQGVQYISYRGWGAADGWHYPAFHNVDLNNSLVNGARMPIVFSIVCNTGDFANSVNPCFGEKWMRMGTIENPGGCVAFVGPTDLRTKTNYNNTISTGMFSSILDDGERNIGAAVLAGKMELYHTYPLELANDQYVAFYFRVYHILSDPTMNMWMLVPSTIPASVITNGTTFSQSDSHIEIQAPNLNGAYVTGTRNNIDYSYAVVHDGYAILPIDPEQTGNLTVTVSRENFVPLVATLTPSLAPTVGIIANDMVGQLVTAGQSCQVNLTVKNYSGSALTNIAANLTTDPADFVTVQNPGQTIASLAAGATTNLTFNFTINGNVPARKIIRFDVAFPNQSTLSSFELRTGGAEFVILNASGDLNIGAANLVSFTIMNTGTFEIQNATATIRSRTSAANVVTETVALGNLAVGASAELQTSIFVEPFCYNGRNIPLTFIISTPAGYQSICYFDVTAGNPTNTDPTGPDGYGYFAYDSFDVGYPQHPVYEWIEIDPRDNNNTIPGEVHLIMDDGSYTVDLPFTFRYYGVDYNSMTICSNGWTSFVTTWMADFNNLYIPAALGPYAMVAPYWDDLKGMKVMTDSVNFYFEDMRICNWYDEANNRYIVEWNDAYSQYTINLLENAHLEKLQMILYPKDNDDGDIVFQYHTIDNPAVSNNFSTVGVENHLQNDGLTYTYADMYPVTATPLQAGLAIKFTTSPPDNAVSNQDHLQTVVPFRLAQNYPNPFNPETTISFSLAGKSNISLDIYNMKGQKIRTLHSGVLPKGNHSLVWDGTDDKNTAVSSGVYIYKMRSAGQTQTRKMILMK